MMRGRSFIKLNCFVIHEENDFNMAWLSPMGVVLSSLVIIPLFFVSSGKCRVFFLFPRCW